MGMFAGIVGGAMEGAGKAGVSAFHTAQEHLNKKELQDAEHEFQTSLEGVRQSGADRRLDVTELGLGTRQGVTETGLSTRLATSEKGLTDRAASLRQSTEGIHSADRTSRETVSAAANAAHISVANIQAGAQAATNANALAIAKLGGTVQTDKDGYMFTLDKENKLTPLMIPPAEGDPYGRPTQMKTHKDLTPSAKVRAETLKAQLIDTDRAEVAARASSNTDTAIAAAVAAIEARRADLTRRQLQVLQGLPEEGAKGGKMAPQKAKDELAKDPKKADEFYAYYTGETRPADVAPPDKKAEPNGLAAKAMPSNTTDSPRTSEENRHVGKLKDVSDEIAALESKMSTSSFSPGPGRGGQTRSPEAIALRKGQEADLAKLRKQKADLEAQ